MIAPSDQLMNAKVGYAIAVTLGTWLPIVALLLLVGGVLVAARRPLAALWAAIGLGFGALFVLAGISVGRTAATIAVPAALMPSDVVTLFYDTVIGSLSDIALATLTLAIVAGLTIWITGPFAHARQLRAFTTGIHESLNRWAADRGLSTGRFGLWLHAQRAWISALVAVLAALTLLASRPISVEEVLGTATVAIVVLLILGLLSRSPQESAPVEPAAGDVADQAQAG